MSDTKTVDVLAVVGRLVDLAENSGGRRGEDEVDNEPAIALFESGVAARTAIAKALDALRNSPCYCEDDDDDGDSVTCDRCAALRACGGA